MRIGLIGNGFVGNAVYQNLREKYEFLIYDTNPSRATAKHIKEVCEGAPIIFVALPTPMKQSGTCDLSIISGAMASIAAHYNNNIIILKSTVPPGTCEYIKDAHPDLRIVFSPEFLTEANFVEDFRTCNRMIFGGEIEDTAECVKLLSTVFPEKYYVMTNWKTAETVKYFINNFLAVKVAFANEFYEICKSIDVDYSEVVRYASLDERLGNSHLSVPGPDGDYGFGGTCFPKDINAMIAFSRLQGVDPAMLESAWRKNLDVRQNKDWLKMFGRAVSSDDSS